MNTSLFHNAIALAHVNKKGGEMLSDFETVLKNAGETRSIAKLLELSGEDFIKTNANEAMSSDQVGFGKDWVEDVVLSTELIDRLRDSSSLLKAANYRTMSGKVMDFPVKGTSVRMILTSEENGLPGTTPGVDVDQVRKATTATIRMTAEEYVITVYYSDTLLEDSVIAIADYVMGEIATAFERSLHEVLINGDTATGASVNINIIDGNTSALPDGNKTDILGADGIRKTAIDNAGTVDAGGNLSIENIRSARALMGLKGVNPANLVMIPSQDVYFSMLNLTELETIEKFGAAATIKNGVLSAVDGIEIITREELGLATATGEISATPANNTLGQIAIVHKPSVNIGYRRQFATEVSRFAEKRQTGVTGSTRFAVMLDNTQNTVNPTLAATLIVNI
jgi:hypothetical protein